MAHSSTPAAPSPGGATQAPALEPWLREILRCPATGATLVDAIGPDGQPELVSTDPDNPLAYPIRDGIPVLLVDDARPVHPGESGPHGGSHRA